MDYLEATGNSYRHYHVPIEHDVNHYRLVFTFSKVDEEMLQVLNLWIYVVNKVIATKNYTYS